MINGGCLPVNQTIAFCFFNRAGKMIELEADQAEEFKNLAMEADWHDIPLSRIDPNTT